MKSLFSATVCGVLALVLFLASPARSSGAAARIANPEASTPALEASAPASTGDTPSASTGAHPNLPRYYFGGYITVDEKSGETKDLHDQNQHNDLVAKIKESGIPQERILERDPGDCLQANPCEELSMREETTPNGVILLTTILQKPTIADSKVAHNTPLKNQTAKKDNWYYTRSCLSKNASYLLWIHDQQHQSAH
jgi:hypothetical protein